MNSDRYVSELCSVVSDHLSTTLLVKINSSHLRGRHVRNDAKATILAIVHPGIAVCMVADIALHLLQLDKHLLASVLLKRRLRANLRIVNERETWSLDLILLIMDSICQVDSLPGLLLVILLSLLDGSEAGLATLAVKLALNVGLVHRLVLLPLLLERRVKGVNFLAVRSVTQVS